MSYDPSVFDSKKEYLIQKIELLVMKNSLILPMLFVLATITNLSAQPESADFMRSTGKIYVVIAVLCIIFIGIVLFLINLDRKLQRLEKEIK
jgi:CcmD family protein